jgi:hypothetical protein
MGWDPLTATLERWFADAWTRGMHRTAIDLAWIVSALRDPSLTVSPGLRVLLDVADDGAEDHEPSEALTDGLLAAVALELRRSIERFGRTGEPAATYVVRRVTGAAAGFPGRSP